MTIEAYLRQLTLLSDQVDKRELSVILRELERTLERAIPGDVVEFGCYEGTTSVPIAKWLDGTSRRLYVYDSFEGLPEKTAHDASPAGEQFKTGELLASKKTLIRNFKQANVPLPVIKKACFRTLPSAIFHTISRLLI